MYGICVQRSKKESNVKNKLKGENRTDRSMKKEGRAANGRYGETIYDIINWIYRRGEVNKGYHWQTSNCQIFASVLFEAIDRQKYRRLDNVI